MSASVDPRAWMIRQRRGGTLGPFTKAEIVRAIAAGEIVQGDEVRYGEGGAWKRLNEVTTFAVALRETKHAAGGSKVPAIAGLATLVLLIGVLVSWWLYQPKPEQRLTEWLEATALPATDPRTPEEAKTISSASIAREVGAFTACRWLARGLEDDEARFNAVACLAAAQPLDPSRKQSLLALVQAELAAQPRRGWWWLIHAVASEPQAAQTVIGEAVALEVDADAAGWARAFTACTAGCEAAPTAGGVGLRAKANLARGKLKLATADLQRAILAKPAWCEAGLCRQMMTWLANAHAVCAWLPADLAALTPSLQRDVVGRLSWATLQQLPEPRPASVVETIACAQTLCTTQAMGAAMARWRAGEAPDPKWLASVSAQSSLEEQFFAALLSKGQKPWPAIEGPLTTFYTAVFSAETDETLRLDPLLSRDDTFLSYNPQGLALFDAGLRDLDKHLKPDRGGRFLLDLAQVWLGQVVAEPDTLAATSHSQRRQWKEALLALDERATAEWGDDNAAIALMAFVSEQSGADDAIEWWKNLEDESSTITLELASLRDRARSGEGPKVYEEALLRYRSGMRDSRLSALLWSLEP